MAASISKQAREKNLGPNMEEEDNRKGGGKEDLFHGQEMFDASKLFENSSQKKDRFQALPRKAVACLARCQRVKQPENAA
ncbi:MAG: hypothetical protein GC205_02195 [Bacteroidetes bacterium]|nr:hypothetical protein [Bacteroidota bacterium]